MAHPTDELELDVLRLDFDRRLIVQFRGSVVTSDAGLLAYRELDDALGLTAMAGETLADTRTGEKGRHALAGLLTANLARRSRSTKSRFAADNPTHRRIVAQALGVVHVLIFSQASEH